MTAALRLHRAPGFALELPAGPGLCETCRERPATPAARYCDRLCALFDIALAELAAAIHDAPDERCAAPVVVARTRLRAVASVYDAHKLRRDPGIRVDRRSEAAAWRADVAAGLLLPDDYAAACAEVRAAIG